jgi:hypothetical protein
VRRKVRYYRVCPLVVIIFFLTLFAPPSNDPTRLPTRTRRIYFHNAYILHQKDIAETNIWKGPQSSIAVLPEAEVTCLYVDEEIETGATPKFKCRLFDSGQVVRVKYERRETFAELAGTRLLWALGFYIDHSYPVQLKCLNCPEKNPSDPSDKQKRGERIIYDAIMEENFPGTELAQFPDQGWKWSELDHVLSTQTGASKAEIDALKLLAVFLQHTDSKPSQQRLACHSENLRWQGPELICTEPALMIQDLGATFGRGHKVVDSTSAMYYQGWSRTDIWNSELEQKYFEEHRARKCIGRLTSAFDDGLSDPIISEEGRSLLAHLLNQLTDAQLQDLFRLARVEQLQEKINERGNEVVVTVQHWVSAFKKKREQINHRRCN